MTTRLQVAVRLTRMRISPNASQLSTHNSQLSVDRISQSLTQRVKELVERYETPLPQLSDRVVDLEAKVNGHLERMGFAVAEPVLAEAGH